MGCCDKPIPGPVLPREAIIARRNACRECEHASRNPAPRFQPTRGLTTRSICALTGKSLFAVTQCPPCQCPKTPSGWPSSAPKAPI